MAQAKARVAAGAEPSKSRIARPAAPSYAETLRHARARRGGVVCDARGREFADFVNDQGAVLLGWDDREVEAEIAAERNPELLEIEAAGRLVCLIPGAEAVAFAPSFEAALADALLAAKALTGRDGAYFVDEAVSATGDVETLTEALDRVSDEAAAVVIRPLDAPRAFLSEARRLTRGSGAVLIFDESKSAFRVHRGGAQGLTGVQADITLIGSSIANGRRMAALAGPLDPMRALRGSPEQVPAAALAAACVTLKRVEDADAAHVLRVIGAEISVETEARLKASGAWAFFDLWGDPSWTLISARPDCGDPAALEAALTARLHVEGVLSQGGLVPSLATGPAEIGRLLDALDAVLPALTAHALSGAFERRLTRRAS